MGKKRPPRLVVTGPRGERFVATGNRRTRRLITAQVPAERRTYVFVRNPRAGIWRVAGGTRVRSAAGLRAAKVTGKIRKRGTRYELRWKAKGTAGQRIEFLERADGVARRIGKVTRKRRGRIRFTSAPGRDTTRTIEAVVRLGAVPRATVTVARFKTK